MLCVSGVFFWLSNQFYQCKCLHLIAGYNDLTVAQKVQIDRKLVGRSAGKSMLAGGLMILGEAVALQLVWLQVVSQILAMLLIGMPILLATSYILNQALKMNRLYQKQ